MRNEDVGRGLKPALHAQGDGDMGDISDVGDERERRQVKREEEKLQLGGVARRPMSEEEAALRIELANKAQAGGGVHSDPESLGKYTARWPESSFIPQTTAVVVYQRYTASKQQVLEVMNKVVVEIHALRNAGQKEYAHDDADALRNFNAQGKDVDISSEKSLWLLAMKHRDGIAAYIKGHESQREGVEGRINDLILYLILLRTMVECKKGIIPQ